MGRARRVGTSTDMCSAGSRADALSIRDPHVRAVDHQMNRIAFANKRQLYIKRLSAATKRRIAQHRRRGERQISQASRKALQGVRR